MYRFHNARCNNKSVYTVCGGLSIQFSRLFLVSNQLDAQFIFLIRSFQFSTCFEQLRAHHQENQLYQYSIRYMSLYVGDRLVRIMYGHLRRVTYTRCCIDTIDSPDDEHGVARNMLETEMNIRNKNCASS